MIKISPSILSADFTKIFDAVKMLENAGADYIHCDVMDGSFVPNITFGQYMIRDLRKHTKLPLDVHLMINNPDKYIVEFADAGADIITVHAEATNHLDRSLQLIRSTGKKAGVSLNPHTPLSVLEYVLYNVDMVLLMSVNPGFGGQSFIDSSLDKARALRAMIQATGRDIDIEMDGGISAHNIKAVTDAGVNVIVAGNSVFSADNPADMIKTLKLL
ncbi:MAG: ribulose-phosphate 3-epimerase [Clostridia bacterium]|jgi:ribulose-phosphate 3-epimerase|nr:ribulose-phosphate 3-epimerase [Clostridia bacterium]MBT7121630.1 ribulose-phosphate 3-epimerase [Clostridia bacterium]